MAARGRQSQMKPDNTLLILIAAVLGGLAIFGNAAFASLPTMNPNLGLVVLLCALLIILFVLVITAFIMYSNLTADLRARKMASLRAHEVDGMTGTEFEIFLKHLLTARGYTVEHFGQTGDNGVDLVAQRGDRRYSIQVKRYNDRHKADRRAISDAVAGMTLHNCTHAMAITNSYFTKAAIEYGKRTNCELVDREVLADWIHQLQEDL